MEDSLLQTPSSYYDEFVDPNISAPNAFCIRAEHLMRYIFAKQYIRKNRLNVIYDIACGNGYGTTLLAKVARHVYGFDASERFLSIATHKYSAKNITYVQENLDESDINIAGLQEPDAIVSFETLEHVEYPKKLLLQFFGALSNGGYLFLSTPNAKLEPKKKGKSRNKFHKHIFEKEELVDLLHEVGFTVEEVLGQSLTNIVFHNKVGRDILNKLTERYQFLFKILSYLGYPNNLFKSRSYSLVVVAKKEVLQK